MSKPAARHAWLLCALVSVVACQPKQPEPDANAKTEPAAVVLTIRLTPAPPDSLTPFDFTAEPMGEAKPLDGIDVWNCTDSFSELLPCGGAKICADLSDRWATQIGAGKPSRVPEYEEDCAAGNDPQPSSSGDFVEHAAVIRSRIHSPDSNSVIGIVAQTKAGWQALGRIHEVVVKSEPNMLRHEPRAAWQLELDGHPGKELALLIMGFQISPNEQRRFTRLLVCRASPEPSCRRLELSAAKTVEALADGSFVVDGGEPRTFESLEGADQPLIVSHVSHP